MTRLQIDFRSADDCQQALDDLIGNGWSLLSDGDLVPDDEAICCEDGPIIHIDDSYNTCNSCCKTYSLEYDEAAILDDDCHGWYCCSDCAERADLHLWESDGLFHSEPECDEDDEGYGLLPYYSTNPNIDCASDLNPYRIGFEVEKEDSEVKHELYPLSEYASRFGWIAVGDGSLDSSGFELVSPCWNLARLPEIKSNIDRISAIDADCSIECGGHITVSAHGETGEELINRTSDFCCLLMAMFPLRLKSQWSRHRKLCRCVDDGEKYRAFNVKSDRVELRLFSRVKNREQLKWRLDLVNWGLQRDRIDVGQSLLRPDGFLRNHLLKRYREDKLQERIELFVAFRDWFHASSKPFDEELAETADSIKEYVWS